MLAGMFSCISRNSRTVRASCLLSLGALLSSLAYAEVDSDRAADRLKFEQAVTELRSGAGPRYARLRAELTDYPLALYLDALVIEGDLHHTKPDVVKAFLARTADSPVALRTLRSFVRHKVKDRAWKTVVEVTQDGDLTTELRCHRAHALRRPRAQYYHALTWPKLARLARRPSPKCDYWAKSIKNAADRHAPTCRNSPPQNFPRSEPSL